MQNLQFNAADSKQHSPSALTETREQNVSENKTQTALRQSANQTDDDEKETEDDEQEDEPNILEVIEGNPKLKTLLIKEPEALKQKIEEVPKLKELFEGINIDELREEILKKEDEEIDNKEEDISDLLK